MRVCQCQRKQYSRKNWWATLTRTNFSTSPKRSALCKCVCVYVRTQPFGDQGACSPGRFWNYMLRANFWGHAGGKLLLKPNEEGRQQSEGGPVRQNSSPILQEALCFKLFLVKKILENLHAENDIYTSSKTQSTKTMPYNQPTNQGGELYVLHFSSTQTWSMLQLPTCL